MRPGLKHSGQTRINFSLMPASSLVGEVERLLIPLQPTVANELKLATESAIPAAAVAPPAVVGKSNRRPIAVVIGRTSVWATRRVIRWGRRMRDIGIAAVAQRW